MNGPMRAQGKERMVQHPDYDQADDYMPGGADWGPQDGQYLDSQDQDGQYLDQGAPSWQGGDEGLDEGQGWEGHPGPARGYGGVPQRSSQGMGNNSFARAGAPGQGQHWGPGNGGMPPPQQMPYGGPMGGSARAARRQPSATSQGRPGPGPMRGGDDDLYNSDGAGGDPGWSHQQAPPQQQQGMPPQGPPPYHPQAMGPKGSSRSHSFGTDDEQWYPDGVPGNGRGPPLPPQGQVPRGGGDLPPPANAQKMAQYKSSMRRPQIPMDSPGGPGQGMPPGPLDQQYDSAGRGRHSSQSSLDFVPPQIGPPGGQQLPSNLGPPPPLHIQQQQQGPYGMQGGAMPGPGPPRVPPQQLAGSPSRNAGGTFPGDAERPARAPVPPQVSRSGRQVVQCEWCSQLLGVPAKLEPSQQGIQKLRCGKCLKVSKFSVVYPPDGANPILEPLNAAAPPDQLSNPGPGPGVPASNMSAGPGPAGNGPGAPNGPSSAGSLPPDGYGSYPQAYEQGYGAGAPHADGGYPPDGPIHPDPYGPGGMPAGRQPGNMAGPGPMGQQGGGAYGMGGGMMGGPGPGGYARGAPPGYMGSEAEALGQQMGRMQVSGGGAGMPPQQHMQYQGQGGQGPPGMYSQQHTLQHQQYPPQGGGGMYGNQQMPPGGPQRSATVGSGMGMSMQQGWQQGQGGGGGYGQGGGHAGNGPMVMNSMSQEYIEELQGGWDGQQGPYEQDMPGGGAPRQSSGGRRSGRPSNNGQPPPYVPRKPSAGSPAGSDNDEFRTEQQAPPQGQASAVLRTLSMKKPSRSADYVSYDEVGPSRRRTSVRSGDGLPMDRDSQRERDRDRDRERDREREREREGGVSRSLTAKKMSRPPSDREMGVRSEPSIRRVYSIKGGDGGGGDGLKRTYTERAGAKGGGGGGERLTRQETASLNRSNTMAAGGDLYNRRVIVNMQPIPDRFVASVEMRIGKMEAGKYWYDPRSGFWGPWGGPLFGAIPPGLKEFGSTLPPPDCSNGTANVFINGRQLQKKELSLLLKKGLPDFPGSRFSLDGDGTVGDTAGRPIKCIGKLYDEKKRGMWLRMAK